MLPLVFQSLASWAQRWKEFLSYSTVMLTANGFLVSSTRKDWISCQHFHKHTWESADQEDYDVCTLPGVSQCPPFNDCPKSCQVCNICPSLGLLTRKTTMSAHSQVCHSVHHSTTVLSRAKSATYVHHSSSASDMNWRWTASLTFHLNSIITELVEFHHHWLYTLFAKRCKRYSHWADITVLCTLSLCYFSVLVVIWHANGFNFPPEQYYYWTSRISSSLTIYVVC